MASGRRSLSTSLLRTKFVVLARNIVTSGWPRPLSDASSLSPVLSSSVSVSIPSSFASSPRLASDSDLDFFFLFNQHFLVCQSIVGKMCYLVSSRWLGQSQYYHVLFFQVFVVSTLQRKGGRDLSLSSVFYFFTLPPSFDGGDLHLVGLKRLETIATTSSCTLIVDPLNSPCSTLMLIYCNKPKFIKYLEFINKPSSYASSSY